MPIVRSEQVIDSWSMLVKNAQGKAEEIFKETGNFLNESKVPNVKAVRSKVAPGVMRGLFGDKREFFVVRETKSKKLKPYQMFINARDYGINLDVNWYLIYRAGLWNKIVLFFCAIPVINFIFIPYILLDNLLSPKQEEGTPNLDFFEQQDLRAYVTNAHYCFLDAVEKLMSDMGQDISKIDRKSRGFLGVS